MELSTELYQWLASASILTEYDIKGHDNGKIILEAEPSQHLEMGLKMPELIKRLHQQKVS